MIAHTVFLRLEGPLQAWGDTSKFVIRRSMEAPTKSGVTGLICCAMGLSRENARDRLPELNTLAMGVRIDRPGTRWWDYHTVGARIGVLQAKGGIKINQKTKEPETLVTRREYLCDASFLVALRGDAAPIRRVADALADPVWPIFLGRKSCPPAAPVLVTRNRGDGVIEHALKSHTNLTSALRFQPWHPRCADDERSTRCRTIDLPCLIEWRSTETDPTAPTDAEVWHDAPISFDPPVHEPRLVVRSSVTVTVEVADATPQRTPPLPRQRADYSNTAYKLRRKERLQSDLCLCVFCKNPATTVHHVTYRHAGGNEEQSELRSLCRLCHDAVTMIEYGLSMGLDRIDPCEPRWRNDILRTRGEIVQFRSEEGRRRALRGAPKQVRSEVLEEGED